MAEVKAPPPSDPSDETLVERVAAGDQAAFAQLYDRHAARLLGLLVRWFPNRGDAEDVLQDVFWQVWKTADKYVAKRGTVTVWLYLLTRSRSVDHLRRQGSPTLLPDIELGTDKRDALDSLVASEQAQRIREALGTLPAEQRRAIHLAFFCGLTHEQLAQKEGIPLGTAKTRIWLAIRRLRNVLKHTEVSA